MTLTYRVCFTGRADGAIGIVYPMTRDIVADGPGLAIEEFRNHSHDRYGVEFNVVHWVAEVIQDGQAVQNKIPAHIFRNRK